MAAHSSGATCASDVFSATIDGCARQSVDIEHGRVASAQGRQQTSGGIDDVVCQEVGHRARPASPPPDTDGHDDWFVVL